MYELMKNTDNEMSLDSLVGMFGKKTYAVIYNMKRKAYVEQVENKIILKDVNFKFSLRQMNKTQPQSYIFKVDK